MKQFYKYILLVVAALSCLGNITAQTYNGGTWYSLYDTSEKSAYIATIFSSPEIETYNVFAPLAGSFSFDSKLPGNGSSSETTKNSSDPKSYSYGVSDYSISFGGKGVPVPQNVNVSHTISDRYKILWTTYYVHSYTYEYNYKNVSGSGLAADQTSLEVKYQADNKHHTARTVFIKNVKVPMAKHIRLTGGDYGVTSVNKTLSEVYWGKSSSTTVNFRSFLTNGNITVKLTSGDKNVWRLGTADNTSGQITKSRDGYSYAVGGNQFAYNGSGACSTGNKGKASGYDFVVYFCPSEAGNFSGTITITDGTSTATVNLSGHCKKRPQTIYDFDFPTGPQTVETSFTVDYNAYTKDDISNTANNLPITYSSNNTAVATVDANGVLTIHKDGDVTITASQEGNKYYNAATSKSVTYHIIKRNQTIQGLTTAATHNTTDIIDFNAYTIYNTTSAANNLSVRYESQNTDVATIDEETGAVTIIKDGTVTIKATQAGDFYYYPTSATVTFTISKVTPTLTAPTLLPNLTYEPGVLVQERWDFAGSAKDDKNNPVAGDFTCTEELRNLPAGDSFTVTFTPDNTNWYTPATCTITPALNRKAQEIVWTMEDGTECLTGTALGAYATSGLHVEYSSSDETVATVDNLTGELVVSKINSEVEVTVCQAGDLNYLPAECVSKTLMTVGARPDDFSDVTASDITYEQSLANSTISGTVKLGEQVIEGSFSWVHSSIMPDAGDAMQEARFTPTDNNIYSPANFMVNVHVNKAQSVITPNIANPLVENTTYYNPYSSNNTESPINVTIKIGTGFASYAHNQLTLAEVNPTSNSYVTLTLTVEQAATDNYIGKSQEFTYKVYKKSAVCLPIAPLEEETFAQATVKSDNAYWCDTDEDSRSDDYPVNLSLSDKYDLVIPTNVNVIYSQRKGIQLGTFQDGLTGWQQMLRQIVINWILGLKVGNIEVGKLWIEYLNWRYNANIHTSTQEPVWSDKYVELSFTGVPDSLFFGVEIPAVETRAHINLEFDYFGKHYQFDREILPVQFPATQKWWSVEVYKGGKWVETDKWSVKTRDGESNEAEKAYALDSTVRSVRIHYKGNFAGFVKNLTITRKHYIKYVEPATLTFGTSSPLHPLQEPQRVNIRYSSIAASAGDYCDNQEGYIVVSSSKPDVFYADVDTIRQNTNFDLTGNYDVNIRCTDVNATGDIIFRSSDGLEYRLPVRSENINITAANPATDLFRTGTEQSFAESTAYRGITDLDFSGCFDESGNPLYDTLYIFGVTGNVGNAQGYHDFSGGLQRLPVVNTPSASIGCNAHTPCFVYRRNGNAYSHSHTVQAASDRLGVLTGNNTKLYLTGYCPFANTGTADEGMGFVCFTGKTDVYLENFEASSRNHTISGSSTPEPQDQTFYLGDNYLSSGIGTLLAWTNSEANIHLKGQNSLRAAYGKQIGKATARSREIVIDMSDIENTQVPAAAITFLPQADNDAWNLSIDNVWIDGSTTNGELTLQGSDGAGSIDVGTPYATINIGKNILGEEIVRMADVVDGVKKIGCRLFMAENKGQGVSVYGIGDFYEPKASAWAAALPGRSGDAAVQALDEQNHVLYASLDPVNVAAGLSVAGEIDNSSSYKAAKRQTLLLNAPADTWQTFVAPFDITDVFILEAIDESTLSGKTISEGKLIQAEANKELLSYLASEIPAAQDQPKADKSTVILISNWLAQKRDAARAEGGDEWTGNKAQYNTRGLYEIEHYDPNFYGKGKSNIWTSSWYLYEVEGGADSWTLNDDGTSFNSEWQAVHRGDDGILMHKGKTYAWQLPYCVACPGNTQWDYWSGKILVFEGYGEQDIDGALDAEDLMSEALTEAVSNSAEGYFAGNTALRPINLPADAFVHDTDPASPTYDYFVKKSEGTEVGALSAALFTKITPPKGMHLSAVARSGKIVYDTDETELTTDLETLYGGHTASTADNGLQVALTASGIMVTITDDRSADSKNLTLAVFSADGKRVYSEPVAVGTSVELNLTQGVYMLSTSDGRTAKVLIR